MTYKDQCKIYEKEIEELQMQIEQLQQAYTITVDKSVIREQALEKENAELKAQIEKMKCCYNCSKWNDGQCKDIKDSFFYVMADFNCDKWELEE